MELYFARHGHTDANEESHVDPSSGEINEPLNEVGLQQANQLAELLKDVEFDAVIASPLKRACQTAEIVAKHHDIEVEIDNAWREREIGEYTDLETWTKLFDFDQHFSLEHSEDLRVFFERIYSAIDALKQKYAGKRVLVVSHGGVHSAVYAYANELPLVGNVRVSPMRNAEFRVYDIT